MLPTLLIALGTAGVAVLMLIGCLYVLTARYADVLLSFRSPLLCVGS